MSPPVQQQINATYRIRSIDEEICNSKALTDAYFRSGRKGHLEFPVEVQEVGTDTVSEDVFVVSGIGTNNGVSLHGRIKLTTPKGVTLYLMGPLDIGNGDIDGFIVGYLENSRHVPTPVSV